MELKKSNSKIIELIAHNQNHEYQGKCKLYVNLISRNLIVEPKSKEYTAITATSKCHFMKKKNMLLVLDDDVSQNFVLIFNTESRCSKAYDYISNHIIIRKVEVHHLENRLLLSLFRCAVENDPCGRIKIVVRKWLHSNDEITKSEYLKLMKENRIDISHFTDNDEEKENFGNKRTRQNTSLFNDDSRKRKYFEERDKTANLNMDENNWASGDISGENCVRRKRRRTLKTNEYNKTLNNSMFKYVVKKHSHCRWRRLVVFNSSEITHIYGYHWHQHKKLFVCSGCAEKNHHTIAILDIKNDTLILDDQSHLCKPEKYEPDNFMEIKILKTNDYKINEYPNQKILLVFVDEEKILSYQYNWQNSSQKFICAECRNHNTYLTANLCYTENGYEYIEIIGYEHVCEPKNFNPKKYEQFRDFVLKPNFEIRTTLKNGKEQPTLIVFAKNDKTLCYAYHKLRENIFSCSGCNNKEKKLVSATLCKNDDGEEYVIFSNVKHVCSPRHYVPKSNEICIYSPNFEHMENTSTGAPKLFIFDENDKTKSYIFSKEGGANPKNRYYCTGCYKMPKEKTVKNINGREIKGIVKAYLCKNETTNEYFVRMAEQKHLCKSKKHKPENFEVKENASDEFVLFRPKTDQLRVAFYLPENKNLCFQMHYFPSFQIFQCRGCKEKKKCVTAKLKIDQAGKEYFIHNLKSHICRPLKSSILKQAGIKILEKSGLCFEKKTTKKIDESKIIRKPDFEFRDHPNGGIQGKVIVLHQDDKTLCYEYTKSNEYYKCIKCKIARAKVDVDERGQNYLILGKNEHQCEPIKYLNEETNVIKSESFLKFNRDYLNRPEALVIFTSSGKEMCYEMDYLPSAKNFRCRPCTKLKKCVTAKIYKNQDGEEYVRLLREHICQPQKYNPQTYQPIIIPASQFQLMENDEGQRNSKLNVNTNDKKNPVFEFILLKDNIFICIGCQEKGRLIHAVLREENDTKYLEVPEKRHKCIWNADYLLQQTENEADHLLQSKNESAKKKNGYTHIKEENFKLFEYQRQGALIQKLIIFETAERKMCHIYINDNNTNIFECCKCRDNYKIKICIAKLKTDLYGKSFVEVENHSCPSQKYDPEKFKERKCIYKPDYEIVEGMVDGLKKKKLIIFDPTNKELCYEYYNYKNNTFECSGCHIRAKIFHEKTPTEYVELYSEEHICQLRPYDRDALFKESNYIYEPDYEIQIVKKDGKDTKRLILFDSSDKTYCFEYTFKQPYFTCCRCKSFDHGVYATLATDSNGKECIKLGTRNHICEPQLYVPQKDKDEVTTEITNYEFVPSLKNSDTKNLILFTDEKKKFCYEFYPSGDRYYCRGCTKTPTRYYGIKINEDENGKHFMTMKAGQKHGCKPIKYDPANYESAVKIIKAPYFTFYKRTDKIFGMIIYAFEDKQLCYNYNFQPGEKKFHCSECSKLRNKARATVHLNIDGEEYIKLGSNDHVCKPLKFSTIKSSILKYVKANDFVTPKSEHQGTVITDFELRNGKDGSKDAVLIAFDSNDRNLCYILNYRKSSKTYACNNCGSQGSSVSAKDYKDESGRRYFAMRDNDHICKPVKYEPEKEKFRNYEIVERNAQNILKKLIVFTNDERTHCYEYLITTRSIKCFGCKPENVTAKLAKDKDGIEYVEFGKQEHICEPIAYDPTKYANGTIIPSSQFELFPNSQGTIDKKLIIFDANDYNLGYEYSAKYKIFNCMKCAFLTKNDTNAKLIQNENCEKYLEHFKTEHICEIQNLFKFGRIIYSSNYRLGEDSDGTQILTSAHPEDSTKCYKFQYSNEFQAFYCLECRKRNKIISGKICTTSNGNEFFVLAYDHICKAISSK